MTQLPKFLAPGDAVAICATARFVEEADLLPAITFLQQQGFVVKILPNYHTRAGQLAGTKKERLAALQTCLDDAKTRAVFFARGGYGTVHLLDHIDWSKFLIHPKWLVGFSDLTGLLNEVQIRTPFPAIHGPMPITFPKDTPESWQQLMDFLKGRQWPHLTWEGHPSNKIGRATGKLTGGNLSVLYSLMGSPSVVPLQQHILFLEDLDEYYYHIDRMLYNLLRNGWLDKISGVIIGSFSDMHDNAIPFGKDVPQIIRDVLAPFNIPVAFGAPCGHQPHNLPLVMGAEVVLEVEPHQSKLTYL